jgi:hypothetical protein
MLSGLDNGSLVSVTYWTLCGTAMTPYPTPTPALTILLVQSLLNKATQQSCL